MHLYYNNIVFKDSEREESSGSDEEAEYYSQPSLVPENTILTPSKNVYTKQKHSSESENSADFEDTVAFSESNKPYIPFKDVNDLTQNIIQVTDCTTNDNNLNVDDSKGKEIDQTPIESNDILTHNIVNVEIATNEKNYYTDDLKIKDVNIINENELGSLKGELFINKPNEDEANVISQQCSILLTNLSENALIENSKEVCKNINEIGCEIIKDIANEITAHNHAENTNIAPTVDSITDQTGNEIMNISEEETNEIVVENTSVITCERHLEEEFFEASHEENDEEDEFLDTDNQNNLPAAIEVLNKSESKNFEELHSQDIILELKTNLSKESSKSTLDFKVFDDLLHGRAPEAKTSELENKKKEQETSLFAAARGGKYNKLIAPIPPEQSNQTDQNTELTSHPIKATLVLKPGVIKSIPTPAEEPKTIFMHKSPKLKRKTSKSPKHDSPISRLMMLPKKLWGTKDQGESSDRRKSSSESEGSRERLNVILEDVKDIRNMSHSSKHFRRYKKDDLEESD